jgi:glycerophosphoryl diester phosphodiesterase
MKPWLVAHRGASAEAKENTIAAINKATAHPVGYIEFDVRVTSDGIAILHHDPAVDGLSIANNTWKDLYAKDRHLTKLSHALKACNGLPLFVELKSSRSASLCADYLLTHPKSYATSFLKDELLELKRHGVKPERLFLAQHYHPFGHLRRARKYGFGGITAHAVYLTPSLYRRANRHNIQILTYTVNLKLWAALIRKFFPKVFIGTDAPSVLKALK